MNKKERFCDVDNIVEWRHIITILLALVTMAGQGQVKCHIEGTFIDNKWGDEVVICKMGTDLRVNDAPEWHHKAVNGYFECDIETDVPEMYEVIPYKQYVETASYYYAWFLVENGTVRIEIYGDKAPKIESIGNEGRLHQTMDSVAGVRFRNEMERIDRELEEHKDRYFKPEFLSLMQIVKNMDRENQPKAFVDSINNVMDYYYDNERESYTDEGWQLFQRSDSLSRLIRPFQAEYYAEHPMLWAYYQVLQSIEMLKYANVYQNFDSTPHEQMVSLYESKLCNLYIGHPVHGQITTALTALRFQPGKPYIDYMVRNINGQLVPISSLIRGKVALIDLWASWCGPCRRHSKAMIPIYEKYKDKGFTVVAIARERNREDMENAAQKDGYPWTSLLELNDENHVWEKNGAGGAGGAMYLIDRDGTILSTSTDAKELEPIIKKALNIE